MKKRRGEVSDCKHEWDSGEIHAPFDECPYCRIAELEATIKQTKELVNLYFEGCAADTFDDAVMALRKALGEAK